MKNYIYIATFLLAIMLFFCVKSNVNLRKDQNNVIRDTITVIKFDTIKIAKPIYIIEKVVDTILVPIFDTLRLNDTLYQPIVKTQKYYTKDSAYQAWVSGFRPQLDSINVFTKTINEKIEIKTHPKKWGVGIIGGYGAGNGGFSPYFGVGLYYNIWTIKN